MVPQWVTYHIYSVNIGSVDEDYSQRRQIVAIPSCFGTVWYSGGIQWCREKSAKFLPLPNFIDYLRYVVMSLLIFSMVAVLMRASQVDASSCNSALSKN
jgi:hypothetical protein